MQSKFFLVASLVLLISFISSAQTIRKPFGDIDKEEKVLTLTNGKYEEFFDDDSLQRIGTALININTMKVVKLQLTEDEQRIMDNSAISRFLSVDPITNQYPELTPYQFASNSPIFGIDRDGKELWGNNFLFDIWLSWKFGDPTGYKTLKSGIEQKAVVQTKQMSYNNNVPKSLESKLDQINNIEANAKIAAGTAQLTKISIQTSFDIASTIAPVGEGIDIVVQGVKQLSRARLVINIYKQMGLSGERLASHLKYYDFEKQVYTKSFDEGTELIQYQLKGSNGAGDYYALPGTKPEEIGLDPNDIGKVFKVKLDKKVEGNLISSHKKNVPLYYDPARTSEGGGTQVFNTEIKNNATFTEITPKL